MGRPGSTLIFRTLSETDDTDDTDDSADADVPGSIFTWTSVFLESRVMFLFEAMSAKRSITYSKTYVIVYNIFRNLFFHFEVVDVL